MRAKFLIAAAAGLLASASFAQVTVYGIADAAVRHSTNAGPAGSAGDSVTTMVGGGLSQSRVGFKAKEDLGGGLAVDAVLEHRFTLDNGQPAANVPFWQLSYVGLTSPYGRVTLGRQFNVMMDVSATTFAPFKFSPYVDAFKPELGFAFGARQSNMLKYAAASRGVTVELQFSAENGDANSGSVSGVPYSYSIPNKSRGAMLRYEANGLAVGGAYLEVRDSAGKKARASTLGASYEIGKVYMNAAVARNAFEPGFGSVSSPVAAVATAVQGQLMGVIVDSATTGVATASLDQRELQSVGLTYTVDAHWRLGAQLWNIRQKGLTPSIDGSVRMAAVAVDYAFSARTDAYFEMDRSVFEDGLVLPNGATTRTGTMLGLRHRF